MANNIEKFIIELGFDSKKVKELKEVLRMENSSQRASKKHAQDMIALERKRLQLQKEQSRQEKNNSKPNAAQRAKEFGDVRFYRPDMQYINKRNPQLAKDLASQAEAAHGDRTAIARLNATIREHVAAMRQAEKQHRANARATNSFSRSTMHLAASFASVYAVMGSVASINRVGQQFEALDSAMLTATGTTQAAASEIEFLDKMTDRLGLSLIDTSDAYSKFLFASKGKLDSSEARELFTGLSELGTTLGISKDRMKLSMNAISQMMNKGKISSEELRLIVAS